jgi:hypothetical protein
MEIIGLKSTEKDDMNCLLKSVSRIFRKRFPFRFISIYTALMLLSVFTVSVYSKDNPENKNGPESKDHPDPEKISAISFTTDPKPAELLEEEFPTNTDLLFSNENSPYGFMTYRELAIWGSSRNLGAVADCPQHELQNHIAALIPVTGLKYNLYVPYKKRMYLYLDLVSFRPLTDFKKGSESQYCTPSLSGQSLHTEKTFDLPQIQYLEVRFNGLPVKRIYMGGGVFPVTPVIIPVDRENVVKGVLRVELRPSGSGVFFAIWDSFISQWTE